jgi:hypothetical protein
MQIVDEAIIFAEMEEREDFGIEWGEILLLAFIVIFTERL